MNRAGEVGKVLSDSEFSTTAFVSFDTETGSRWALVPHAELFAVA
jgi:hypothetical protein